MEEGLLFATNQYSTGVICQAMLSLNKRSVEFPSRACTHSPVGVGTSLSSSVKVIDHMFKKERWLPGTFLGMVSLV
jgi:hypothetical protein